MIHFKLMGRYPLTHLLIRYCLRGRLTERDWGAPPKIGEFGAVQARSHFELLPTSGESKSPHIMLHLFTISYRYIHLARIYP